LNSTAYANPTDHAGRTRLVLEPRKLTLRGRH